MTRYTFVLQQKGIRLKVRWFGVVQIYISFRTGGSQVVMEWEKVKAFGIEPA